MTDQAFLCTSCLSISFPDRLIDKRTITRSSIANSTLIVVLHLPANIAAVVFTLSKNTESMRVIIGASCSVGNELICRPLAMIGVATEELALVGRR